MIDVWFTKHLTKDAALFSDTIHLQNRKIGGDSVHTLAYNIPNLYNLSTLQVTIVSGSYDNLATNRKIFGKQGPRVRRFNARTFHFHTVPQAQRGYGVLKGTCLVEGGGTRVLLSFSLMPSVDYLPPKKPKISTQNRGRVFFFFKQTNICKITSVIKPFLPLVQSCTTHYLLEHLFDLLCNLHMRSTQPCIPPGSL